MTFLKIFILREPRNFHTLQTFLAQNWEAMAKAGRPILAELKEEGSKRSRQANAYYWAALHQISDQAWVEGRQYSEECWHEAAKRRILGIVDLPGGGVASVSTASLSTKEFAAYVTQVEVWAASELGIQFMDMGER